MTLNENVGKALLEYNLPVGFIKNGFIKEGRKPLPYKYEDYLIELLNCSEFFLEKTKGERFQQAADESHGESDATTQEYSIDYKLILGKSLQYAKNLAEQQIHVLKDGGVGYAVSKASGKQKAVSLHRALRRFDENDLKRVMVDKPVDMMQDDVKSFLLSINKNKNLFLLYPVIFEHEESIDITVSDIADAIYNDYGLAIRLIRGQYSDKETYVGFFYKDGLEITKLSTEGLTWVDRVKVDNSPTFCWLMDFYWLEGPIKRMNALLDKHKKG